MAGQHKRAKNICLDLGADVLGSLVFATGIISFVGPAQIAPGGVSGISLILNYLWGLPIGTMSLILNIPLLILSYRYLGHHLTYKTIKSLVINTLMIDMVVTPFFPVYTGDRLLGAVFGGVAMGAGLAIIFLRGSTTGGTDIVSYLVQRRWPHISIGRAILMIDCVILGTSMVVFKSLEAGLFGMVSLFCSTRVIDTIIYGQDKGSMVTVVSERYEAIAKAIMEELQRGVTLLQGQGAYSGKETKVLICAVRKPQFARLKAIIYENDPKAFVVVSEAGEILGEGFKAITNK